MVWTRRADEPARRDIMKRKKILFIGGSINQTRIAHAVYRHLADDYEARFSPYYCDGFLRILQQRGVLDFCILGGQFRDRTMAYFRENRLPIDEGGRSGDYDLIVTTTDLLIQKNIRRKPIILIQEGMTDPENILFHLVRALRLPRWLAGTSTTGLSCAYDAFCVASHGYRRLFIRKGADAEKIVVTGIPNFDNAAAYRDNDFPLRGYVLAATSDCRETFRLDSRAAFIRWARDIAAGRPLVFKLHPNERTDRATAEIKRIVPQAVVFSDGDTNRMIANADVLITQYSSVVYIGLALGKEVHSYFDLEELRRLLPQQNGGRSAARIARVCRGFLENEPDRFRAASWEQAACES